ncbi:EamA family transporter, partial [Parasutterella excrementihominis]
GHWTPMAIVAAVFVVVFGTVGAFWCYLRSTEFIPPALTSILASFEPLSAVVLCVLLLGTSFNYIECIGAALIISNLFILSIPNDKFRAFFPRFRRAGLEN